MINIQTCVLSYLYNNAITENKPVYYEEIQKWGSKILPKKNNESWRRTMQKMAQKGIIQRIKGKGKYYV